MKGGERGGRGEREVEGGRGEREIDQEIDEGGGRGRERWREGGEREREIKR